MTNGESLSSTSSTVSTMTSNGVTVESQVWVVVAHNYFPNGSAHRLVSALTRDGNSVGFCGVPMPSSNRFRLEWLLPEQTTRERFRDEKRQVPRSRELLNLTNLWSFARRLRQTGVKEILLIGCDPVAFVEAARVFKLANLPIVASAVWFVDWPEHRLASHIGRLAYLSATKRAIESATVVAACTQELAGAMCSAVGRDASTQVAIVPNPPLRFSSISKPWIDRPAAVAYMGGLLPQHGVEMLATIAQSLANDGTSVLVIGDGPGASNVRELSKDVVGLTFYDLIEDIDRLGSILAQTRVGLALYDPAYTMYQYGSATLKMRDYLSAGLRVVTTLPNADNDGAIYRVPFSDVEVLKATRSALSTPPTYAPSSHNLVEEATIALRELQNEVLTLGGRSPRARMT